MTILAQLRPARTGTWGRLSFEQPDINFLLWEQTSSTPGLEPAATISSTEAALLANDSFQQRITLAHQGKGLVRRTGGRRDAFNS